MYDILCTADDNAPTLSHPTHSIYDVTSTSGRTTQPLYQTSHPLYLCHYNFSTDITPTFVWHHTHYMCDIICTIYNIISSAYVITVLYLWEHNLDIRNHIQYAVQNIHYPSDITVSSLCHHTHYIWHRVHCICVITFTVLMISQKLYFWDHIHYNSRHHIHCIRHDSDWICVITPTRSMISHPFYVWHHTHYMYNII